jgi:hypothetical protein
MLCVCFDTNAIGIYRPLESNAHALLFDATKDGHILVCVPELVLDEALNLWREKAEALQQDRTKTERQLMEIGLLSEKQLADPLNIPGAVAEKRERLENILSESGALLLPLPTVSHRAVVDRALSRSQPFDSGGRTGYRDVLLWENVLELVSDGDEVVLVSGDVRAFCQSKNDKRISDHLVREVAGRCDRPYAVRLVATPEEALKLVLGTSEETEGEFKKLMADEAFMKELLELMGEELEYLELDRDVTAELILKARLSSATITAPQESTEILIRFARRSNDGLLRVDFQAAYKARLMFSIPVEDFQMVASTWAVDAWSLDDDDVTANGEIGCSLMVLFEASIDAATHEVVEVRPSEVLSLDVD